MNIYIFQIHGSCADVAVLNNSPNKHNIMNAEYYLLVFCYVVHYYILPMEKLFTL